METLWGDPKGGNAGMVASTATAVGNLLHTIPGGRTVKISKVCAYNNSGVFLVLLLGTQTAAGAFVQMIPALGLVNGMDNEFTEDELPILEFALSTVVGATRTGSIYFIADNPAVAGVLGVVGCQVSIEVREKGS